MNATPRCMASDGDIGAYATPSIVMVPALGATTPATIEFSVDLPAPFSPIRPSTLPGRSDRSTAFSTGRPTYCLVSCRQCSPGSFMLVSSPSRPTMSGRTEAPYIALAAGP